MMNEVVNVSWLRVKANYNAACMKRPLGLGGCGGRIYILLSDRGPKVGALYAPLTAHISMRWKTSNKRPVEVPTLSVCH